MARAVVDAHARASRGMLCVLTISCALSMTTIVARTVSATTKSSSSLVALEKAAVRIAPDDRSAPKPIFVAIHGMCEDAEDVCPRWSSAIGERGFLVCPRGNVTCKGGGRTWAGDGREDNVFFGVEATRLSHGGEVDVRGGTLIGFSLGAPIALDLASRRLGAWKGLVLVASLTIEPDPQVLARAGIERVVLAVGDLDMSRPHMLSIADRLRRGGMPTRFVGLGKIGHAYPADLGARMSAALSWVQGGGDP